jgi:hypothetical protein
MEQERLTSDPTHNFDFEKNAAIYRKAFLVMLLCAMLGLFLVLGLTLGSSLSREAVAADTPRVRTVYAKKTELDFEGAQIEGELKNPGEFYFQHKSEEKFDSLVKRRKNFHREMLRDVVLSK